MAGAGIIVGARTCSHSSGPSVCGTGRKLPAQSSLCTTIGTPHGPPHRAASAQMSDQERLSCSSWASQVVQPWCPITFSAPIRPHSLGSPPSSSGAPRDTQGVAWPLQRSTTQSAFRPVSLDEPWQWPLRHLPEAGSWKLNPHDRAATRPWTRQRASSKADAIVGLPRRKRFFARSLIALTLRLAGRFARSVLYCFPFCCLSV